MRPAKVRVIQMPYRILLFTGGRGLILGATMGSKNSGLGSAPLVITRFCKAGSYVAAMGRNNGGIQNFTANNGLNLVNTNSISEGIVPADGTYTFTSGSTLGNMAGGVVEITGTGALTGLANANATLSTNPGTLAPAPANPSIGFAFETATAIIGVNSPNIVIGSISSGTVADGFATVIILAQQIPATPGTVFSAAAADVARGLSRKLV